MRLKTIFIVLAIITFWSCDSNDDNDRITPESRLYEFFENADLIVIENQGFESLSIESGTNTVFNYKFSAEDNRDIADDEYSENIYFEIDGSLDSFSFSNNELRDLNLFIRRSCFCANVGFVYIGNGSVTGTKLANGNWDVSISISFEWEGETQTNARTINGTFTEQPIPN